MRFKKANGAIIGSKVKLADGSYFSAANYINYLYHKYLEVNYGYGLVPFDRIFGTFHDGSDEDTATMNARFLKNPEVI